MTVRNRLNIPGQNAVTEQTAINVTSVKRVLKEVASEAMNDAVASVTVLDASGSFAGTYEMVLPYEGRSNQDLSGKSSTRDCVYKGQVVFSDQIFTCDIDKIENCRPLKVDVGGYSPVIDAFDWAADAIMKFCDECRANGRSVKAYILGYSDFKDERHPKWSEEMLAERWAALFAKYETMVENYPVSMELLVSGPDGGIGKHIAKRLAKRGRVSHVDNIGETFKFFDIVTQSLISASEKAKQLPPLPHGIKEIAIEGGKLL